MKSLKTTFSDKQETSEAKFNEKRQNLDSYNKNGKKKLQTEENCPINAQAAQTVWEFVGL